MKVRKRVAPAYGAGENLEEILDGPMTVSATGLTHRGMTIVSPSCDPEGITGHFRSDHSEGSLSKEPGDLLDVDELFK